MFQVYMSNWANNYNVTTGNFDLVAGPTEILSIPTTGPDKIWTSTATVKAEVNKAESFDFSVDPGTTYYNAFLPMKTWIRVVYDTATIFWGRIKSVSNSTILQRRSVHAEGIYSVLADSPVEGLEEDLQPLQTMREYLDALIANHNSYIEENAKKFTIGTIAISLSSDSKKRAATGWSTTISELDKLIDETGGYVRARYASGTTYLDWYKDYFRDLGNGNRPVIQLKRNLIDISKNVESNEIFTRVIPIGNKSTTTDSKESKFVYLDGSRFIKIVDVPGMGVSVANEFRSNEDFTNAEKNYGIIYKTVNFSNASTSSQLREYCLDWISKNYYGIIHNFSIKAIDMHMIGESDPQILIGDCVDVVYPEYDADGTPHMITRKLICKAIQYDLLHPENNVYTLGVPCDAVDFEYGSKAKKKSASKAAAVAEEARVQSSGTTQSTVVVTWATVRAWLDYYYRTIPNQDIVDWTETRWATFASVSSGGEVIKSIRDEKPRDTFNANGEFYKTTEVYDGKDDEGVDQYTTKKDYITCNFTPPGGGTAVKGSVLGHYQIDVSKRVKAVGRGTGARSLKGRAIDYLTSGHYGVCVTTDGHVYTFEWTKFYNYYKYYESSLDQYSFPTYFEIGRVANGKLSAASEEASARSAENPAVIVGDMKWENYDGKTTAQIAASEGWAAFGFITDKDGKTIPAITINEPFTYIDADGVERTIPGMGTITAQELNLRDVGPFTTKLANIDYLLSQRATITELRAYMAMFGGGDTVSDFVLDANGEPVLDPSGKKLVLKEGTEFFVNTKNIVGASGLYGTSEYIDPETGRVVKSIYIKDGAGLKIQRNGAEYGVYDDDSLTGGIIVNKINTQSGTATVARLKGDMVSIGDKTLSDKVTDIEKGILANGKKIANLDADVVTIGGRVNQTEADIVANNRRLTKIDTDVVVIGGELEEHDKELVDHAESITVIKSDITKVKSLLADVITTDDLNVHDLGNIRHVRTKYVHANSETPGVAAISATGDVIITNGELKFTSTGDRSRSLKVLDVQPNASGDVLTITYVDGSEKTFKKATPAFVSGSWGGTTSDAVFTFKSNPANTAECTKMMGFGDSSGKADFPMMLRRTGDPEDTYTVAGTFVEKYLTVPISISSYDPVNGATPVDRYTQKFDINCTKIYNRGYDAVESPSVVFPDAVDSRSEKTDTSFLAKTNNKTSGAGRSRTISLRVGRSVFSPTTGSSERCVNLSVYNPETYKYVTIGRVSVQQDYNAGFDAVAAPMMDFPVTIDSTSTKNTIYIGASIANKTGGSSRKTGSNFYMRRNTIDDTRYAELYYVSGGNQTVGRISVQTDYNDGKAAGAASVTLNDFQWANATQAVAAGVWEPSSRNVSISTSNGKSKNLMLYLDQGNWDSSNAKRVYVMTDGWNGVRRLQIKVDASAIVQSAVDAAIAETTAGNPTVTFDDVDPDVPSMVVFGTASFAGKSTRFGLSYRRTTMTYSGATIPIVNIMQGTTIVGRYDGRYLYDSGYDDACNNAISVEGDEGKKLDYSEEVTVSVYRTYSNGTKSLKAQRTFIAPANNSSSGGGGGGSSHSNSNEFTCTARTVADGGRTFKYTFTTSRLITNGAICSVGDSVTFYW